MNVELIVEGRHFPAAEPRLALAFAQHIADDAERPVQVFEQAPGDRKVMREVVRPNLCVTVSHS